jgi:four helix bundle protein
MNRMVIPLEAGRSILTHDAVSTTECVAPANIAEGSAKRGPKEFRRFLDTALGSLAELSYAILFAKELGYLSESDWKELDDLRNAAGKLTWGLYRLISDRGA